MLLIGRYIGERIIIRVGNEEIVITALAIATTGKNWSKDEHGGLKIGLDASENVKIYREEIDPGRADHENRIIYPV